jgi:uncharacterized protein
VKHSRYLHAIPTVQGEYAVYNALTDALAVLTEPLWHALQSGEYARIPADVARELHDIGILLDDDVDELRIVSYRMNRHKFANRAVTGVTILTTTACNFACPYCYEGVPGAADSHTMTGEVLRKSLTFIQKQVERNGSRILSVTLFGGEPLVNKPVAFQILEDLHRWCNEKDVTFVHAIVTNGSLLDQETADVLARHGCKGIQITVDGPREIHDARRMYKGGRGSFDRVMEAIRLVYDHPRLPKPVIRVNVDKTNVAAVPALLDELASRGLADCPLDFGIVHAQTAFCASYADRCYEEEELPDVLPTLWRAARERGFSPGIRPRPLPTYCGLLTDFQFVLDPQGNVYKCWEHVGSPQYRTGTVEDEAPGGLFHMEWMARDPVNQPGCRSCDLLPVCGGGCAQAALARHGTIHAPGCSKTKGLITHRLRAYLEGKYPELLRHGAFAAAADEP